MCPAPREAALAAWLKEPLDEQAGTGRALLRLRGAEEGGVTAFRQAWIGHLHGLTDRARAQWTSADSTSLPPATPSRWADRHREMPVLYSPPLQPTGYENLRVFDRDGYDIGRLVWVVCDTQR